MQPHRAGLSSPTPAEGDSGSSLGRLRPKAKARRRHSHSAGWPRCWPPPDRLLCGRGRGPHCRVCLGNLTARSVTQAPPSRRHEDAAVRAGRVACTQLQLGPCGQRRAGGTCRWGRARALPFLARRPPYAAPESPCAPHTGRAAWPRLCQEGPQSLQWAGDRPRERRVCEVAAAPRGKGQPAGTPTLTLPAASFLSPEER